MPAYAQPYPQYGAPPGNDAPKGMAITALILSFLGCTGILAIVSIVLSVIVLRRGKDGRNHGKGMAIAAIVISVLTLLISIISVVGLATYVNSITDVSDLKAGQCINADGLTDATAEAVSDIEVVGCSEEHDGEVIATATLSKEDAEGFATDFSACDDAVAKAGKAELIVPPLTYTGLSVTDPEAGDKVMCVAYNTDGTSLTGKLGS